MGLANLCALAIRRYGEANPDSWTGLRFENEPRVRIVASFVGDLEQHEYELRRLLAYPDRLVFEQSRWIKSQLDDIASEIHSTLRQRQAMTGRPVMGRLGVGIGVVSVGLQADQEELAGELAQRYGDAVELEVGAFAYPMGRKRSRPRSPRGPEPEIGDIEGLELRLHPERRVFEVGDRGQADLVVSNVSTHHVGRFHCGQPLLAMLVDESGQVVGGPAPAAIAGTGRSIDLDPGDELKIKVLIGTASYREELGYLLPGSAPTYGSAKASRRTPRRERSARHLNRSRLSRGTAPKCPQRIRCSRSRSSSSCERSQHSQVTSSRSF